MPPPKPKKGKPDPLDEARFTLLLKEVQAARREIAALHKQGKTIMATVAELNQKIADLQAAIDAAEARADARDAALAHALADLQAAFDALKAAGADIPQASIDAVDASIADLNAFAVPTPPIVGGGETPVP